MDDALLFVLIALASYRAWRFVALDDFPPVTKPRDAVTSWIQRRHGDDWANGIACAWCAGAWCTAAVVASVDAFTSVPLPVLVWAAAGTVVGLLGDLDG